MLKYHCHSQTNAPAGPAKPWLGVLVHTRGGVTQSRAAAVLALLQELLCFSAECFLGQKEVEEKCFWRKA